MKKIILILLITVAAKNIKAQSYGVSDTLVYLHSIAANKAQYIGQPFSKMMDSLKIQIKFFSPFASLPYNKTKETSTSYSFYFPHDGVDDFYLTYPKLEIHWQTPLNANHSDVLWRNNNGGGWSSTVAAFYANAIIADIKIRE